MDSFYIGVPRKVLVVECQDALDAMYAHCRDEARIVDLHARDAARYQNPSPFFMNTKTVREQTESFLEGLRKSVCLLRRETVAIAVNSQQGECRHSKIYRRSGTYKTERHRAGEWHPWLRRSGDNLDGLA